MLDRMSLSLRNGWLDDQGRVYIYFTLEDAIDLIGCGHNKMVRIFKELETIGLIERKKQGLGKPAIIYVKNFISAPDLGDRTDEGRVPMRQDKMKKIGDKMTTIWYNVRGK